MSRQVVDILFNMKYIYPKTDYTFSYGKIRVLFCNTFDRKELNLKITGVGNTSLRKVEDNFFAIYELLFFMLGFFPPIKRITFNGMEESEYMQRITKKYSTAKKMFHSQSRFFALSLSTINSETVKSYCEIKKEVSLPLDAFFATQSYEDNQIYGEHRFILASHAAEGIIESKYDKFIAGKKIGYRERIKFFYEPLLRADRKCKTKLISSIGVSKKTYFELLKNTRHFYTHLCKERKRFKNGTEFLAEYYIIVIAFRLFMLEKIGIAYDPSLFARYVPFLTDWMKEFR